MEEEVQLYLDDAKERMQESIKHLEKELLKIRAGKANAGMLDSVLVESYGSNTPIKHLANVGTSDARTILIQPWDKAMIAPIERAIMQANLGFNPDNNGETIRINVPPLTEDRRRDLVKQVRQECENAKIAIRAARKDTNTEIKKLEKDGLSEDVSKDAEDKVQKLTDSYTAKIDKILIEKEEDIMTV